MKTIITLLILTTSIALQGQTLKLHSISGTIPGAWISDHSNPYEIGINLNSWVDNSQIFAKFTAYADRNSFNYYETYLDESDNSFKYDKRIIENLELGDSTLSKLQQTDYIGYGIRLGTQHQFDIFNFPFESSAYFGLTVRRSTYWSNTRYIYYEESNQFGRQYERGFPGNTTEDSERWTISPQLGGSIGVPLLANKRFSIVPRINANLTVVHRYSFDGNTGPQDTYLYDFDLRAAVQFNYHILKNQPSKFDKS